MFLWDTLHPWSMVLSGFPGGKCWKEGQRKTELSDLGKWKEICSCSLVTAKTVYLQVCVFQGNRGQQRENALLKTFPRIYVVHLERYIPPARPPGFHAVRMRLACLGNPQPPGKQSAGSMMEEHWSCHEGRGATLYSKDRARERFAHILWDPSVTFRSASHQRSEKANTPGLNLKT